MKTKNNRNDKYKTFSLHKNAQKRNKEKEK